jgi:hypothetical protein
MKPYFFKIDEHISMLLSLFVHHSLEGWISLLSSPTFGQQQLSQHMPIAQ